MKINILLVATAVAFFTLSCNSNPTQNSALNTKRSDLDSNFNICYSSVINKDTVLLNALMYGDSIKGSLGYKLYEKERNNGFVLGKMYGDTLKALYTFMVKDSQFINEITFLRTDTLLIEGLGKRIEKEGKLVFENQKQIRYKGLVLAKSDCK